MNTIEQEAAAHKTELGSIASERLEAEICQLAADLAAGTARWLALIGEYDRREVWKQWECRSMAHWLVWHCGISIITARQQVHVARTLVQYPLLTNEFSAGRLSYSRVRALCRVITPECEADMVSMAKHATAPQLERFAAGVERVKRAAKASPIDRADRGLTLLTDDEGVWILRARLLPEQGTALARALGYELSREEPSLRDASPDAREGIEARRADALLHLVERGHTRAESDADTPDARVRPLVVLHRYPDGDELERGPALDTATADMLACDADVVDAVHTRPAPASPAEERADGAAQATDAEPSIRFTRRRRMPTLSARRFLQERDQSCRFPGCNQRRDLTPHHIDHHTNGGVATRTNLIMLCAFHHASVHQRKWTITGNPDGQVLFQRPYTLPTPPSDTGGSGTNGTNGDIERIISDLHGPLRPQTNGDRLNLHYAVSVYFHNLEIVKRRAAVDRQAALASRLTGLPT